MGGMIAQKLAVLHPKAIGHLILINTSIAGEQTVPPTPEIKENYYIYRHINLDFISQLLMYFS